MVKFHAFSIPKKETVLPVIQRFSLHRFQSLSSLSYRPTLDDARPLAHPEVHLFPYAPKYYLKIAVQVFWLANFMLIIALKEKHLYSVISSSGRVTYRVAKYLLFPEVLMLMTVGGSWGDMPVAS